MAGNVAKAVLDLLFPTLCIGCRTQVGQAGFCAACWGQINFLDGPGCACCGLPFPVALEGANICAACLTTAPAFDSARAILAYDEKSRGAILALKHADRLDLVPGFAHWPSRTGRGVLEDSDLVAPVPLHPWRLWRRRYNQSAEVARRLARDWGLAYEPMALISAAVRDRQPRDHGHRPRQAPQCAARLQGSRSGQSGWKARSLLDDVLTTGATAEVCARALKRAGAAGVHVLVLARVVKAPDMLI